MNFHDALWLQPEVAFSFASFGVIQLRWLSCLHGQAYRLLAEEMYLKGWDYPLHLGVTEVQSRCSRIHRHCSCIVAALSRETKLKAHPGNEDHHTATLLGRTAAPMLV